MIVAAVVVVMGLVVVLAVKLWCCAFCFRNSFLFPKHVRRLRRRGLRGSLPWIMSGATRIRTEASRATALMDKFPLSYGEHTPYNRLYPLFYRIAGTVHEILTRHCTCCPAVNFSLFCQDSRYQVCCSSFWQVPTALR